MKNLVMPMDSKELFLSYMELVAWGTHSLKIKYVFIEYIVLNMNGIVYPKIKILSPFTHLSKHVWQIFFKNDGASYWLPLYFLCKFIQKCRKKSLFSLHQWNALSLVYFFSVLRASYAEAWVKSVWLLVLWSILTSLCDSRCYLETL